MTAQRRRPAASAFAAVSVPLVAVLTALVAARATGALAPLGIEGLPDPGRVTRVGLPIVQAIRDVASLATVGMLVVSSTCLPPGRGGDERTLGPARGLLLTCAQLTAAIWAISSGLLVALIYSDASGTAITAAGFAREAIFFGTNFELGQYALWGAVLAGAVTVGCLLSTRPSGLGITTALALLALWPAALSGHAAGTLDHEEAVNLQLFHLVATATWTGGLLGLVIVRRTVGDALDPAVRRFSTLAGWCLAVVAVSGTAGAWLRLPSADAIASPYGALLTAKVSLIVVVALMGRWHRRRLLAQTVTVDTATFWRIVAGELVVLSTAVGVGVALSRTAPPAPDTFEPLTPAQSLIGRTLPEALNAARWFTSWEADTLFLPVGIGALLWYVIAALRLRRRGVRWPMHRVAVWVVGCVLFLWATNGAPGVYGRVLFSMHMVQHMTIATAVPVFLVLGAPVTLALRTLRKREDGSLGPREWLLLLVHSVPLRIVGHPIFAAGMFVVGMVAFYYSSLFQRSLESHTAHILMTFHFLISGYLFAESIVGIDPGLRRPAYPLRALLLMVTFGFHALFAVSLMSNSTVLAEQWFALLDRPWGMSLKDDQYLGASLGWALGEYPLAIMAVAFLISWLRADRRESRRFDRREDRSSDRELAEYNEYLRRLASADRSRITSSSTMGSRSSPDGEEELL